jgi:thiamine biosynthesis protein ThiI
VYGPGVRIAIHYAEIGLKGKNRPRFVSRLRDNLEHTLAPWEGKVRPLFGRLLAELPDDCDYEAAARRIRRVFGVAWFSRAVVCEPDLESIWSAVAAFVDTQSFETFGIRARRPEKAHPFTSRDLAIEFGNRIRERSGASVDLGNPDLWIDIHVLSREALVLHEHTPGPGGLPVGSSGRAISLISGGIDSPVSSYEMMKRGLRLIFAHFHSAPFTSEASQDKVREAVARLARHQGPSTLYLIPFGELQRTLVAEAPAEPRIVLYRRFMLRVAEVLAERERALALVTGEALGQVSSQTLANVDTINRAATLPVLRPLIGSDKAEIIDRAKAIGSFATSIEPDDDCCSYLMPRRPDTWTRPERIEAIERDLDVKGLVERTLQNVGRERIGPLHDRDD